MKVIKLMKFFTIMCIVIVFTLHEENSASAAQEREINAQTYYPRGMALGIESFAKEVADKTDDSIQINVLLGNSLLSSGTLMDGIRNNMMPVGQIITHMYPQIQAGKLLAGIPLVTKNAEAADKLFDEYGLFEFAQEELAKYGLVYLGPTWSAPYHLLTKKPVNSLEDLKGMRIRAIGATADVFTKLGVTCINIPPESLYMALQNGEIDGAIFGSAYDYQQASLHEVAPWYNTTPLVQPLIDSLVVSKKTWDTLTKKEQGIFMKAAKDVRWTWYNKVLAEEKKLQNTIFKGKTTSFGEKDMEQFKYAAQAVLNDESAQNPDLEKGVKIVQKFVQEQN